MPRHLAPLTTIASEPRAQTSEPQPRGGDRLSRRRLSSTQLYVPPSPRQVFSHEVPCSKHAYSTNRSQLSDRGVFMTTSPRELNADRQSKALLCSVHQYSTIDSPAVSSFHYYDNSTIPNSPIFGNRHSRPHLPSTSSPSGAPWTRLHEMPPPPKIARRLYNSPTLTSVLPPQEDDIIMAG